MSAACPPTPSPEQPSDGHLRARERGDDQKRQGDAQWRDLNIRGLSLNMAPEQQQAEPNGEPLLSPHVPDGAETMSE